MPLLPNGRLVALAELGHNDVIVNQPSVFRLLMEAFYVQGVVDESLFRRSPMSFALSRSLGQAYREMTAAR